MTVPLAPEMIYRVILDYEGLQEGFADRIEDLNVPLTEVDAAGELTRGNAQKLLCKSDAKWARQFGWESLGKMLKGTGLALALIVDDERFAPIKAQMVKRKQNTRDAKPVSKQVLRQMIAGVFANHGKRGGVLRSAALSPSQRKKIAKAGARARWRRRSLKKEDLPAA